MPVVDADARYWYLREADRIDLVLCTETGKDIARYSVLHDSKQLLAAKYLTHLPSEEELRREIERQKEIFAA